MSSRSRDRSGTEPESLASFTASFALPHADCALPATSLYAPLTSEPVSPVAEPANLSPWPTAERTPPSKLSLFILTSPEDELRFRNNQRESSFPFDKLNFLECRLQSGVRGVGWLACRPFQSGPGGNVCGTASSSKVAASRQERGSRVEVRAE